MPLCITALCPVALQFFLSRYDSLILTVTSALEVSKCDNTSRDLEACLHQGLLLHLYRFYEKSMPGLAHGPRMGIRDMWDRAAPRKLPQTRAEPPSWPRDACTNPAKIGRSTYPTFTWTADAGARVGSGCFKPLNFEVVCYPETVMRSWSLRLSWWLYEQLETKALCKCQIVGSEQKDMDYWTSSGPGTWRPEVRSTHAPNYSLNLGR